MLPLIRKLKIPSLSPDFSLTFKQFSLTLYQWETINAYIRFSFFCRPSIFFSSFSTSFRDNENHWPQLLHVSGVECQINRFASFAAYFSSFPKENAFQSLEEDLWTINRKTEFPDFSLTLTTSIIFPDFVKNSLTFPLTDSNPAIKKYHKN